jgi:hypothetical protein
MITANIHVRTTENADPTAAPPVAAITFVLGDAVGLNSSAMDAKTL